MLDVHKNPLLISILDGVDTIKNMLEKNVLSPVHVHSCKGLLFMKTDKVQAGLDELHASWLEAPEWEGEALDDMPTSRLSFAPPADWLRVVSDAGLRPSGGKGAEQTLRLVREEFKNCPSARK